MFTSLKRIIRAGWINFVRNGGLSAATIFIMVMAIFLMSSLYLSKDLAQFLMTSLQEKVDISVYFKMAATEGDILKLKDEVAKIPEVKKIEYVSREEALARFISRYKDNRVVMNSLAEVGNPLLSYLNIKAWEASQYTAVVSFFENSSYKELVDKIDYYERKPIIERIFSITFNVKRAGIGFTIALGVIAVLVAYNTIRLAIYSTREEIGVMRLVGASNLFIRGPFLVQGAISGFFAALFTLLIFSATVYFLTPKLKILVPDFDFFSSFLANFWTLVLAQFGAGIGLGTVSSFIAVRKYLRV